MSVTINNLTEGRLFVPVVNYTFSRRESRCFDFHTYTDLLNNPTVAHLLDINVIALVPDLAELAAPHAQAHASGNPDAVTHQESYGAGEHTHAEIDTHLDAGTAASSLLNEMALASLKPGAFKQLTYTGSSLTKSELYTGSVVPAAMKRKLTFADDNPDTITASSGGFTTEDFSAGEYVGVQGTTNNDGIYLIGVVATTVITLDAAETLAAEGPLSSGASIHALNTHLFTQDFSYTSGSLTGILVTKEATADQVKKVLTYSGGVLAQVSLQSI